MVLHEPVYEWKLQGAQEEIVHRETDNVTNT